MGQGGRINAGELDRCTLSGKDMCMDWYKYLQINWVDWERVSKRAEMVREGNRGTGLAVSECEVTERASV